jgi:hypothetical protein
LCSAREWDLDLDGRDELVLASNSPDGFSPLLTLYDPESSYRRDFDLPSGPDRNGDGRWDGVYVPVGFIPASDLNQTDLIILVCKVFHDGLHRGVMAIDAATGEVVWFFAMGPLPGDRSVHVVDLDGDGHLEIILPSRSIGNLGNMRPGAVAATRPWFRPKR